MLRRGSGGESYQRPTSHLYEALPVFWFTALAFPPDSWLTMHWHWLWLQPDHLAHHATGSCLLVLVPHGHESQPPVHTRETGPSTTAGGLTWAVGPAGGAGHSLVVGGCAHSGYHGGEDGNKEFHFACELNLE